MVLERDTKRREVINSARVPRPPLPYSHAVKAGNWVFVGGQMATDYATGIHPDAKIDPELPYIGGASRRQSIVIWRNLKAIVEDAGGSLAQAVRTWQWHVYPEHDWSDGDCWTGISTARFQQTKREFIPKDRPASTSMAIRRLPVADVIHQVDMLSVIPEPGQKKEAFFPANVPGQLAGGALGTRVGDWVFLMGEVPTDFQGDWGRALNLGEPSGLAPEARDNPYFWYQWPVMTQTEYTLKRLQRIAEAAGTSLEHTVKADVYLGHPRDFEGFEEVWRAWFPKNPPARTVHFYQGLGIKGARVEITPICLMPNAQVTRATIETSLAPEPITHEPQAIRAGNYLFFSGQMANDERGLSPEAKRSSGFPYYGSPVKRQVRYILKNVAAIAEAAGTGLENIAHCQAFYTDLNHLSDSVEEWADHFPSDPPAKTDVEIGGPLLVPGCEVILNLIGFVPD